jgi:RNA recognition motif-containing protein
MVIYVGNLNYSLQEDDVKQLFTTYGEVSSVKIVRDRDTGRAKGFCFVEMPDDQEASTAMKELNGAEVRGRNIRVDRYRQTRPENNNRRSQYGSNRGNQY